MTDNLLALEARDQWLYVAHHWPHLRTALAGRGGNTLTGMPAAASPEPRLVIDTHVSDLMHEITTVVEGYAAILLAETTWEPSTSRMPQLLTEVAARYGHFTNDPDLTTGFCADANDYREKVHRTLTPATRPTYLGPCPVQNCDGDLKAHDNQDAARCPQCGTTTTRTEHKTWLQAQMRDRLLTGTEVIRAFKTLEIPCSASTVWRWIAKKKLTEVEEGTGLYSLDHAITLAIEKRTAVTAN